MNDEKFRYRPHRDMFDKPLQFKRPIKTVVMKPGVYHGDKYDFIVYDEADYVNSHILKPGQVVVFDKTYETTDLSEFGADK